MKRYKMANEDEYESEGQSTEMVADNMVYITGTISQTTVSPVIGFIAAANVTQQFEQLVIFINSAGGHLAECFALVDVIKASRIPVTTIAIGECDSSALMIAMAGHTRYVAPGCSILSHQYSAGIGLSKHSDLQSRFRDLELTANKVVNHYVECTKLPVEDVKKYLVNDTDVFLTAEEAINYNLFDDLFVDFEQITDFPDQDDENTDN